MDSRNMSYDMVRFERGQVWFIKFKDKKEHVGHEPQKDRPWLILSVGKFNKSSGMITAAPITTRNTVVSPAQVLFLNENDMNNVILCENIRTFDYQSGAYYFNYMGQVSDVVMEKVDVALSIHLGLHYSPITLNKLYDSMEAIIKSVSYMESSKSPKFSDKDVLDFAEKLQSLVIGESSTSASEVSATIEPQEGIKEVPVETSKKIRRKWTPDLCREFLKDANTLPMKKVMEKWNISEKIRYYSMKNYVTNLLERTNT